MEGENPTLMCHCIPHIKCSNQIEFCKVSCLFSQFQFLFSCYHLYNNYFVNENDFLKIRTLATPGNERTTSESPKWFFNVFVKFRLFKLHPPFPDNSGSICLDVRINIYGLFSIKYTMFSEIKCLTDGLTSCFFN